jgi:integrase
VTGEAKRGRPSRLTAALIAAAPEGFDHCLIRLVAETGLRISEVLGLRWEDLELGEPPYRRSVRTWVNGVYREPKSGYGQRQVPLRRELTVELRRFRVASRWSKGTDPVFATLGGRPTDYSTLRRHGLFPAAETAGVSITGFHKMRHGATTDLLRAGLPMVTVSRLIGHHDVAFTLSRYARRGQRRARPRRPLRRGVKR